MATQSKPQDLVIRTTLKGGALTANHAEALVAKQGLVIRTTLKGGALTANHAEAIVG